MSDFNFSNLKAHDVDQTKVVEYAIEDCELTDADGVSHTPILCGISAGEKNKKLLSAALKYNAKHGGNARKRSPEKIVKLARGNARNFFPQFVLTGWRDVYDGAGAPVEFSVEAARGFLHALPNHLLNGVMEYFASPANFTHSEEAITGEDVEEAAGN